jgi:hypothetical protein
MFNKSAWLTSAAAPIFLALLCLCAAPAAQAGSWTIPLTVERAFTEDSDLILIYTAGASQYTAGCTANHWIFVGANEARRGRAYATLLTAIASGKKVSFWVQDECASWAYHRVSAVQIHQ